MLLSGFQGFKKWVKTFSFSLLIKIDSTILCTHCAPKSGVAEEIFLTNGRAVSWLT